MQACFCLVHSERANATFGCLRKLLLREIKDFENSSSRWRNAWLFVDNLRESFVDAHGLQFVCDIFFFLSGDLVPDALNPAGAVMAGTLLTRSISFPIFFAFSRTEVKSIT